MRYILAMGALGRVCKALSVWAIFGASCVHVNKSSCYIIFVQGDWEKA